jgi:hypothetical protein
MRLALSDIHTSSDIIVIIQAGSNEKREGTGHKYLNTIPSDKSYLGENFTCLTGSSLHTNKPAYMHKERETSASQATLTTGKSKH